MQKSPARITVRACLSTDFYWFWFVT